MIKQIYVHPKVEKDIEQMKSLDNAPCVAARRAQSIFNDLVNGIQISNIGRLSGSKDARIKNLLKFNLGKGYRLITIKEKKQLYIMLIGDHDQCDRWLDAYRGKHPHRQSRVMNVYQVTCPADKVSGGLIPVHEAAGELDCFEDISQKALQKVFCGLISHR